MKLCLCLFTKRNTSASSTVKQILLCTQYKSHSVRKYRCKYTKKNNASPPCCKDKNRPPCLHVDHSGQLLDSIEQQVTLLYGFLVLPVFAIRSEENNGKVVRDLPPAIK